jgi:uncharacterized protein (DUF1499 family)
MFDFSGKIPGDLGVKDGKLKQPPTSPNCVNSMYEEDPHFIEPLKGAINVVNVIVESLGNVEVIEITSNYLYVTFKSKFWGFVDDVEFYSKDESQIIHVRSASRIGHSDLGANRKRIEYIRGKLASQ